MCEKLSQAIKQFKSRDERSLLSEFVNFIVAIDIPLELVIILSAIRAAISINDGSVIFGISIRL